MEFMEIMRQLEAAGTAQNREIYARHGVSGPMFGIGYSFMRPFAKRLKTDHDLAERLWAAGNHDARILATLIADPARTDAATIERWARDLNNYILTDAVSALAIKAALPREVLDCWCASDEEWLGQIGWTTLGAGNGQRSDGAADEAYYLEKVATIEREIHGRKNRVRHAMNMALVGLAAHGKTLFEAALAAAGRIGKVHVDHGETGCITPDAAAYIRKMADRAAGKSGGAKGGRGQAAAQTAKKAAPSARKPAAKTRKTKPSRKAKAGKPSAKVVPKAKPSPGSASASKRVKKKKVARASETTGKRPKPKTAKAQPKAKRATPKKATRGNATAKKASPGKTAARKADKR